jgi:hypothetical protein
MWRVGGLISTPFKQRISPGLGARMRGKASTIRFKYIIPEFIEESQYIVPESL